MLFQLGPKALLTCAMFWCGLAIASPPVSADDADDCRNSLALSIKRDACTKIIARDPRAIWAYYNRGVAYINRGEHDLAIDDYNKIIEIDPRQAYAYNNRGVSRSIKGLHDQAFADFAKAIEIDPTFWRPYTNRAKEYLNRSKTSDVLQSKSNIEKAMADYNKAIELEPNNADLYSDRGNAYSEYLNDKEKAVADLKKALSIDPKDELAKARLNRIEHDPAKAFEEFRKRQKSQ